MPQITPDTKHTPESIARDLKVSPQWIRVLCRRVLGKHGHHRLSDAERTEVEAEYRQFQKKKPV